MRLYELLSRFDHLVHGLSHEKIKVNTHKLPKSPDGTYLYAFEGIKGFENGGKVYFSPDTLVEDAGIDDENWIALKDVNGCRRIFEVFSGDKVFTPKEILNT